MICTWLFAVITPSTSLAVDGSARTFNCVEVLPSNGTIVGIEVAGGGVSLGRDVNVAGRVAVMISGVDVIGGSVRGGVLQLIRRKKIIVRKSVFRVVIKLWISS